MIGVGFFGLKKFQIMVSHSQFIHEFSSGSQAGSGHSGHSDAVSINNKKHKFLLLVFFKGQDVTRLFEHTKISLGSSPSPPEKLTCIHTSC